MPFPCLFHWLFFLRQTPCWSPDLEGSWPWPFPYFVLCFLIGNVVWLHGMQGSTSRKGCRASSQTLMSKCTWALWKLNILDSYSPFLFSWGLAISHFNFFLYVSYIYFFAFLPLLVPQGWCKPRQLHDSEDYKQEHLIDRGFLSSMGQVPSIVQ